METKNRELAKMVVQAIKMLAEREDNLDNFECYLSHCFDAWMKRWANTPEGLASELKHFAEM